MKKISLKITAQKLIKYVSFSILVLILITSILLLFEIVPGIRVFSVQSGSMEPTISTGALVIVSPGEEYILGDIITVQDPENPNLTITHRIVQIENTDNSIYFVTKGDANFANDFDLRTLEKILGKVNFSIPLLGFLATFARSPIGFVVMIVIPGIIVVLNEIKNIRKEVKALRKN